MSSNSPIPKSTLVLVHGAWHSGACWTPVVKLLTAEGYQVHAPDLPGHGRNTLALNRVTLKAYVNSIVDLLAQITGPVALVGHSMAGMVISQVAAQQPDNIGRLVYLSAYLPRHNESLFDLIALNRNDDEPLTAIEVAMQMSNDKRSCTIAQDAISPLFHNLSSPPEAAAARSCFNAQATLPLAARVSLDNSAFGQIPRTYISCNADKVIPLHHQRRMLSRQPCDILLQLESDHSPFLSCPGPIAALLAACAEP